MATDLCEAVGIDTGRLGGLIEKPQHNATLKMSDVPTESTTDEQHHLEVAENTASHPIAIYKEDVPPEIPENSTSISELKLPNWLQKYLDWAGSTGNQTTMSFHLAAGLCNLRDLYRNLNLSAKRARQLAQDLVKAGLVVETLVDRAECYVAAEFLCEG